MGAGNYQFRNTNLDKTLLHFRLLDQDYEDVLEKSVNVLRAHLAANTHLVPEGSDICDWDVPDFTHLCKRMLDKMHWSHLIDPLLLDGRAAWELHHSEGRIRQFTSEIKTRLQAISDVEFPDPGVMARQMDGVSDSYPLIATTRFCELGIMEHLGDLYVGVQPTYDMYNYSVALCDYRDDVAVNLQRYLASLALQVHPENKDLLELSNPAIRIDPSVKTQMLEKGLHGYEPYDVVNFLLGKCAQVVPGEASTFHARFGIELAVLEENWQLIEDIGLFWEAAGWLPKTADDGYARDYSKLSKAATEATFALTDQVFTPVGPYTSVRVANPANRPSVFPMGSTLTFDGPSM